MLSYFFSRLTHPNAPITGTRSEVLASENETGLELIERELHGLPSLQRGGVLSKAVGEGDNTHPNKYLTSRCLHVLVLWNEIPRVLGPFSLPG